MAYLQLIILKTHLNKRFEEMSIDDINQQLVRRIAAIRAGRNLLAFSQKQLAEKAGISSQSITRLERLDSFSSLKTLTLIENTLKDHGVNYIETDEEAYIKLDKKVFEYLDRLFEKGESMTPRGNIWKNKK